MRTQYQIRNPRLDGVYIGFDTEWEAMRYWRENVEGVPETNTIHGAVVVRATWETHAEAETARLNWLLGPGSIARFMEECERAPLDYSNPDTWLTNARTAIDICRKAPPSTATVIWPNVEILHDRKRREEA